MAITQTVTFIVESRIASIFQASLNKKADKIAKSGVEYMRKRTDKGLDKFERPFAKRKPEYLKAKKKRIGSFEDSTKFRAGKANDWLRASGQLISDIKYKKKVKKPSLLSGKNGFIRIIYYIDERSEDKAKGHITGRLGKHGRARPRQFFGFPKKLPKVLRREAQRIIYS